MGVTRRLEVRGAAVAFDGSVALAGVDLAVEAGEVVALLGPSGSGKSTLLRVIAGLQPLDGGTVLVDGIDLGATPPHRRGVGLMFQDHALFPHRDVGTNVAFGLRMQGRSAAEQRRRVGELLALVGLAGLADRRIQTLSGGEQQRVALARALAPEPRVLLLDEPLGALDRPLRERLVGELREVFRSLGLTVLAVTHDHAEAFALATRLALLDGGRIIQTGAPAKVWAQPASVRAAQLLGFLNVGPMPGAPDGPPVLVRPDGVAFCSDGPIGGVVETATFMGSRSRVVVRLNGGGSLEVEVPAEEAPAVGAPVRLRISPEAVVPLAP